MVTRPKAWWLEKARLEGDSDVSVGSASNAIYSFADALIEACDMKELTPRGATLFLLEKARLEGDRLAVMPVYADLFARLCPGVGWCWPCKGLLYMATDELLPRDVVETIRSMRDI